MSSSANKRLKSIKDHLERNDDPHFFDTIRIKSKPAQAPNFSKLDPLKFLLRSAMVYAHKPAIMYREQSYTYFEFSEHVKALSNILIDKFYVKNGDRVAILCPNIPAFLHAQYAIPAIGAISVPLNIRLAAKEIEYIIEHSGASVIIVHRELMDRLTSKSKASLKAVIEIADCDDVTRDPYYQLLASSKNRLSWNDMPTVQDENETISINYTSGSTGTPKGVMITYRGVYIMSLGRVIYDRLDSKTVFLWTLPIFHCNGWCFPWAVVAAGGTQVMLKKLDYTLVWKLIKEHGITHFNGAPAVQNEICNHLDAIRLDHPIQVCCGGSALSSTLIKRMTQLNLIPSQAYGLTETYGSVVLTHDANTLSNYSEEEQHTLLARIGYSNITSDDVRVLDKDTITDVKSDGKEVGEICITGNLVMKGYYNNPEETEKAFRHGVFWTGDLAVVHPDGSLEILDRSKDVIISGGENISSLEVEKVIIQLEEVNECAVVAGPDEKWGERPIAFIALRDKDSDLTEKKVTDHCRKSLAGYKCPSKVIFIDEIPKTRQISKVRIERGIVEKPSKKN